MNKENIHPSSNHRVYQYHDLISESKREGGNLISGPKSHTSKNKILTETFSRAGQPRRITPPNKTPSNARVSRIPRLVNQLPNHRVNPYTSEKKIPKKPSRARQVFESKREGETLLRTRRVRMRPSPSKASRKVKISRIPIFVQPSTNHQLNQCHSPFFGSKREVPEVPKILSTQILKGNRRNDSAVKVKARSSTIVKCTAEQQRKRIEERYKRRVQQPIINNGIMLQDVSMELKKNTKKSEFVTFAKKETKRIEERYKRRLQQPIVDTDMLLQDINRQLTKSAKKRKIELTFAKEETTDEMGGVNLRQEKANSLEAELIYLAEIGIMKEEAKDKIQGLNLSQADSSLEENVIALKTKIVNTDMSLQDINRQLTKSAKKRKIELTFAKEETTDEMGEVNLKKNANSRVAELIYLAEISIMKEEAKDKMQGLNLRQADSSLEENIIELNTKRDTSTQAGSRINTNLIALKTKRDTSIRTLKLSIGEYGRQIGRKDTLAQGCNLKEEMNRLWNLIQTLKSRLTLREAKFHITIADSEMRI